MNLHQVRHAAALILTAADHEPPDLWDQLQPTLDWAAQYYMQVL